MILHSLAAGGALNESQSQAKCMMTVRCVRVWWQFFVIRDYCIPAGGLYLFPLSSNRSTSLIHRSVELGARGPPVVRVVGPIVEALPASGRNLALDDDDRDSDVPGLDT